MPTDLIAGLKALRLFGMADALNDMAKQASPRYQHALPILEGFDVVIISLMRKMWSLSVEQERVKLTWQLPWVSRLLNNIVIASASSQPLS